MKLRTKILATAFALAMTSPASAALVSVVGAASTAGGLPMIIAAPGSVFDDAPGAENTGMQGFNEKQGVILSGPLTVSNPLDYAGVNAFPNTVSVGSAGLRVDSQMIFFNTKGTADVIHKDVTWTFSGNILGIMSDRGGTLEAATNGLLGLALVTYPGAFNARGLEANNGITNDGIISVIGNQLKLTMRVTEPGDWIRVVTLSPVPIPAALPMFGTALGLLGFMSWRKKRKALVAA